MEFNNMLLLVIFIIFSVLRARGHEACYGDSWAYHAGTHTCIGLHLINKPWEEARTFCHQLQLGSQLTVTSQLVKIDDEDTNSFVRSLFIHPGLILWIGLHYVSDKLAFRWEGHLDEIPKFQDPSWTRHTRPYVATTVFGWLGEYSSRQHDCVCQHQAKRANIDSCEQHVQPDGLNVTCRSEESPCPAQCQWTYKYEMDSDFHPWRLVTDEFHEETTTNGSHSYRTACSAILAKENALIKDGTLQLLFKMFPDISGIDVSTNEIALSMKSLDIVIAHPQKPMFVLFHKNVIGPNAIIVQGSIKISLSCQVLTGSPAVYSTLMSCESPIKINETYNGTCIPEVIIRRGEREMDGRKCTCLAYHVTGITEESVLTFKVVSTTTRASCHSQLQPDKVEISCHIGKVYPKPSCAWSYRHGSDIRFTSLSGNITTRYLSASFTDTDGLLYHSSICSVTLTSDNIAFREGHQVIQALIYPNLEGINEETTSDAFITIQDTSMIDLPSDAQLVMLGENALGPSPLVEDESITLSCTVSSGTPQVYSVTLACAFPLNKNGSHEITARGTNYVINKKVSLDMNGKTCMCIGNHLTGPIQSLPLTSFVVATPSDVKCSHELRPTGLFSTCAIGKVYPEALCLWSYLNKDDLYFTTVQNIHTTHYINDSYIDGHGTMYFKTNCSILLTSELIVFREGALTVHVTMNPNFAGINKKTSSSAFLTTQEIVNIELPDSPTMRVYNKTFTKNSIEDQTTFLECQVKSGKPAVHAVTLACQFPISDSGDTQLTVKGNVFVIRKNLSSDIEGKTCTCIGHHVTGTMASSPLVIGTFIDSPTSDADSSSNLSGGTITGVVVATNVFVIALTIISIILVRRYKHKTNENSCYWEPTVPQSRQCTEPPLPPSSSEDRLHFTRCWLEEENPSSNGSDSTF